MSQDFYTILGVSRDADADTIKKAYKKLANKHHPDKNLDDPSAEEKFKEVKRAYEVLSDAQQRQSYDMHGHDAFVNGNRGEQSQHDAYADVFRRAFEEQMRQANIMRVQQRITLAQVVKGGDINVSIPLTQSCSACDGTGSKTKTRETCTTCRGSGGVIRQHGGMQFQVTCPACNGHGHVISDPCGTCGGSGQQRRTFTKQVNIPQGVDNGEGIQIDVEGTPVIIMFHVIPDNTFVRNGINIQRAVEIDVLTAILGGKITTQDVLGNDIVVTVPPGIQPNQSLRLSGKGITRNGTTGSLFCAIQVKIPTTLTTQQMELYNQLKELT